MLDIEEYFHLAVDASKKSEHHEALKYLHLVLEQDSDHSAAIYLMAAEHAELGMLDRAAAGMARALLLDPSLEMARFQLAMLHMQLGQQAESIKELEKLKEVVKLPNLKLYTSAMLNVFSDNVKVAVGEIRAGLELPTDNPALNDSMRQVILMLEQGPSDGIGSGAVQPSAAAISAPKAGEDTSGSVFLGEYKTSQIKIDS
ncbi:hypothetical protein [Teredinibacter franksiae]|uniref:hypothetical protein n=1 Tax=Teredinibacter franksiae TaxID=2761453 RepID=UPI0016268DF8|nr:hypothetical protein [Teredinibacter franksiae]